MLTEVSMIYGHYTNLLGVLLCIITACWSKWRFKAKNKENSVLLALLFCVAVSCVADSIAVWADGRLGAFCRALVYASNTWMFVGCMLNGALWIWFIEEHIHGANSILHGMILKITIAVGLAILFINMYLPIVFAVNGNNVYERRVLFFLYMVIQICFMIDAIIMYVVAKYKLGGLSVYPIWKYILPLFIGMIGQLLVYGTSLIWPSAAISTAILFAQFNGEDRYKNSVTNLYRYDYLPILNDKLMKFRNKKYSIVMMQVLGLASIGIQHGEKEEENARLAISGILNKTVKPKGVIVQCENDAFAIVLNFVNNDVGEQCIKKLKNEFDEFNKLKKSEYALTVLFGQGIVDLNEESIENVVETIRKSL